ncbi:unnamed protein product [Spodoptera exigua]|nr:unnamed protein product [Spodoptera exigua]
MLGSGDTTDLTPGSNSEEYINQIVNIYLDREKEDFISGGFEYPFQFLLPVDIPPSFKDTIGLRKHELVVPGAVYYQYDGEQPSCSSVSPRNGTFASQDELKDFEKYEKEGFVKIDSDNSDEEDEVDFDINDKLKFEKLDINEFEDSRQEKNNDKDSHNKEAQSR